VRAVSINRCISSQTQGIIQQPTKIKTPATSTKIKSEVIQPFHLSNHFSIKPVNGSFKPEFSTTLLNRVVNSYRVLVIVPAGAVLFGLYMQHKTPVIMQTPPFSANIVSNASLFSQAI
jgi:hypothetical protein